MLMYTKRSAGLVAYTCTSKCSSGSVCAPDRLSSLIEGSTSSLSVFAASSTSTGSGRFSAERTPERRPAELGVTSGATADGPLPLDAPSAGTGISGAYTGG